MEPDYREMEAYARLVEAVIKDAFLICERANPHEKESIKKVLKFARAKSNPLLSAYCDAFGFDDEMVARQQRVVHRRGRNHKRLRDQRGAEDQKQERHDPLGKRIAFGNRLRFLSGLLRIFRFTGLCLYCSSHGLNMRFQRVLVKKCKATSPTWLKNFPGDDPEMLGASGYDQ